MDFARRQLEKYGWTAGKGLGKKENGITEALKPKLKRSVTGVGHDPASDFTEHWWNDLYNKAAQNLQVEVKGKTSIIKQKDQSDFEITNNMWQMKKKKRGDISEQLYTNNFVKKSILCKGGSKVENIKECDSDTEESKNVFLMTDEELYTACEGRTAHKGARHGLKALGKLARIEQQEQILLNEAKYIGYSHTKKLKKKNHVQSDALVVENNELKDNGDTNSDKTIKYKQDHLHKEQNLEVEEQPIDNTGNRECQKKNKIKDCYKKGETTLLNVVLDTNILAIKNKKTKRKDTADFIITSDSCDQNDLVKHPKKKKIKNSVNNNEKLIIDTPTIHDLDIDSIKKRKKKKKKNMK